MTQPASAVVVIAVTVILLAAGRGSAQGLFPPLISPENFVLGEPVTASSTCGSCEGEGGGGECACNSTCPYGSVLPAPMDLLEDGMPQDGVVRK